MAMIHKTSPRFDGFTAGYDPQTGNAAIETPAGNVIIAPTYESFAIAGDYDGPFYLVASDYWTPTFEAGSLYKFEKLG